MSRELKFASGEQARLRITKQQRRQIKSMYNKLDKEAKKNLKSLETQTSATAYLQRMRLTDFVASLQNASTAMNKDLESIIKGNMIIVSKAVVSDVGTLLNKAKVSIKGAYAYVPTDIVTRISTGKVYESGWSLSSAIWSNNKKIHEDIQRIVAQGTAANKSAFDIAKDLERYVNPNARKDWKWNKVYPGSNKVIDYNAQRLARTLVSHSYQQSVIEIAKTNPYTQGVKWISSGSERTCDLCEERDGKIYPVDDVPLDHPNGMCTYTVVLTKDLQTIANELAESAVQPLRNPDVEKWKQAMRGAR